MFYKVFKDSNCLFETCTAFVLLLIELFGTEPGPDLLTGVAIDRACDVHPYVRRIGQEGSQVSFFTLRMSLKPVLL